MQSPHSFKENPLLSLSASSPKSGKEKASPVSPKAPRKESFEKEGGGSKNSSFSSVSSLGASSPPTSSSLMPAKNLVSLAGSYYGGASTYTNNNAGSLTVFDEYTTVEIDEDSVRGSVDIEDSEATASESSTSHHEGSESSTNVKVKYTPVIYKKMIQHLNSYVFIGNFRLFSFI